MSRRWLISCGVLLLLAGCGESSRPALDPGEACESPKIAALEIEARAGKHAAIEGFWSEAEGKAPLVEPIPSDPDHVRVTFVWRGDGKTLRVGIHGGLPADEWVKPLTRLHGTDLWYRTERLPKDARFAYAFYIDWPQKTPTDLIAFRGMYTGAPPLPDPRNPRRLAIANESIIELPDAPPQPWTAERPGTPRGAVSNSEISSAILKERRRFSVYTPPGYDPGGGELGLLVLFDGEAYGSRPDAA